MLTVSPWKISDASNGLLQRLQRLTQKLTLTSRSDVRLYATKSSLTHSSLAEAIKNSASNYGGTYQKLIASNFAIKWYAYGGSEGLNTAVCVVMVIFYCIVPFLTSLYIGGEQAGMFMSKVISVGSMATQQLIQTGAGATSALGGAAGAAAGGYKGSVIGQSAGNLLGSVGGIAGVVGSAGSGS